MESMHGGEQLVPWNPYTVVSSWFHGIHALGAHLRAAVLQFCGSMTDDNNILLTHVSFVSSAVFLQCGDCGDTRYSVCECNCSRCCPRDADQTQQHCHRDNHESCDRHTHVVALTSLCSGSALYIVPLLFNIVAFMSAHWNLYFYAETMSWDTKTCMLPRVRNAHGMFICFVRWGDKVESECSVKGPSSNLCTHQRWWDMYM